jgi:hypothetical protein
MPLAMRIGADGEIVWSWSPDAGTKLASDSRATAANKPGAPRRARISRNTIAQGRPVVPAEPVYWCAFIADYRVHTSLAGAASARPSLRPPFFGRAVISRTRAEHVAGTKLLAKVSLP